MKKTLLFSVIALLVVVLAVGIFSTNAKAATEGVLTYTVSNGEATITDCSTSASRELVIPSTFGRYPVTSIGSSAFSSCSKLTSVVIPNSVTSIGQNAFLNCTSLTSIEIPDSVMSIERYAFENTAYYNNENNWETDVLYIGKHLIKAKNTITGEYTIKEGTKLIAEFAFEDCSSLINVNISEGITSIGSQAFRYCSGLTSIEIPSSVTSMGNAAFYGCSSLTGVEIHAGVTRIGESAFSIAKI